MLNKLTASIEHHYYSFKYMNAYNQVIINTSPFCIAPPVAKLSRKEKTYQRTESKTLPSKAASKEL